MVKFRAKHGVGGVEDGAAQVFDGILGENLGKVTSDV
jgi:hypothetical protein